MAARRHVSADLFRNAWLQRVMRLSPMHDAGAGARRRSVVRRAVTYVTDGRHEAFPGRDKQIKRLSF